MEVVCFIQIMKEGNYRSKLFFIAVVFTMFKNMQASPLTISVPSRSINTLCSWIPVFFFYYFFITNFANTIFKSP